MGALNKRIKFVIDDENGVTSTVVYEDGYREVLPRKNARHLADFMLINDKKAADLRDGKRERKTK